MIDLLVGMAISLIAMLVILNLAVIFESRRTINIDGTEMQIDTVNAVSILERDIRLSGYGLGPREVWGCKVKRHFTKAVNDLALLPIEITDGEQGQPDKLRILASNKTGNSASYILINPHPSTSTTMLLNSNQDIEVNDILIMHEPGKQCTMFQATEVNDDGYRIAHDGEKSPWNPDLPEFIFPEGGYGLGANVINLGEVFDRTYFINEKNEFQIENYSSQENTNSTLTIAPNIINLQAQYGFDMRSGAQTSAKVTMWSAVMLDADGSQVIGDSGDIQRILAIRFAIVARSTKKEMSSSGKCTTSASPTWRAGNAMTGELENIEIDVSKHPDGSMNEEWRCFRYNVFETVVPLRNLLWGQS